MQINPSIPLLSRRGIPAELPSEGKASTIRLPLLQNVNKPDIPFFRANNPTESDLVPLLVRIQESTTSVWLQANHLAEAINVDASVIKARSTDADGAQLAHYLNKLLHIANSQKKNGLDIDSVMSINRFVENNQRLLQPAFQSQSVEPIYFSAKKYPIPNDLLVGPSSIVVRLGKTLGEGSFKVAELGYDLTHQQTVAITRLRPDLTPSTANMARKDQDNERLVYELFPNQEGIAKFHFVTRIHPKGSNDGDEVCVVMRHYETAAFELVTSVPLKAAQKNGIIRQLIKGLAAMHQKDVVHRDIKLENIFINQDGDQYAADLGDFGFSLRGLKEQDSLLLSERQKSQYQWNLKRLCGTDAHISPELWRNKDDLKSIDLWKSNDVWGLGLSLFELVLGLETSFVNQWRENPEKLSSNAAVDKYIRDFSSDPEAMKLYQEDLRKLRAADIDPILKQVIERMLDPNETTRITMNEVRSKL